MKYTLLALAAASLMSTAAHAGTLTAEVRFGEVKSTWTRGTPDSTEYKVEYWDTVGGVANVGAELQTKQGENAGSLGSKISLKAGPALPAVAGFKVNAYGEVGKNLSPANNFEFWGAGVKVRKDVFGPLSVNAGYRHRQGFDAGDINEERLNAGLGYSLTDSVALGATYYRTRGTRDSDAIGLSVSKTF